MPDLETLLRERPTFTLDELSVAANQLLARLLPEVLSDSRVKAEVNPRLIRHYVSEEMLDPAIRDGRRVVYTVDHLLQLLALRRLLAEGLSSSQIGPDLRERGRAELREIAEGRAFATEGDPSAGGDPSARADASTARAEARAALDAIRGRASSASSQPFSSWHRPSSVRPSSTPPVASDPSSDAHTWERVPLLDGVELHVRSDLRLPDSMEERQRLLDQVIREIIRYAQRRDP